MPAVWFADPRVTWSEANDGTTRLIVPSDTEEQAFTVWFDPATDLVQRMETLRWRDAADAAPIVWINEVHAWMDVDGMKIPSHVTVAWEDQGQPWFNLEVEEVVYNVDVDEYIWAKGS